MLAIIKIILLAFILLVCTSIGILKAKTYDNRVIELKQIKNALEILRTKIEFTYEPIQDIFSEISSMLYDDDENIFAKTIHWIPEKGLNNSWNLAVEEDNNLTGEDKSTIKLFGKLLGKTDKAGQINEINVTSNLLDHLIEKAENERNKNYKLFKMLRRCSWNWFMHHFDLKRKEKAKWISIYYLKLRESALLLQFCTKF